MSYNIRITYHVYVTHINMKDGDCKHNELYITLFDFEYHRSTITITSIITSKMRIYTAESLPTLQQIIIDLCSVREQQNKNVK